MENTLTQITDYLTTQSWQIAVLAAGIAAVSLLLKNKSAHVRYLLWLIVLAKCLTPPLLTIPLAVLPQQQVPQPPALAPAEIPPLTIEPVRPVIYDRPAALPPATPVIERPSVLQKLSGFAVRQWLPLAWIAGLALFFSVTLIKAFRTNFWLRRARRPLPAGLQTAIDNLFTDLGIRVLPKVWLVEDIGQPFVWGLLRGGIYLPADFATLDSPKHRRGVLGHEMSHVLRFDAAVNLLQIIVQGIFWFHPFVWWANKKIRAEREKCCDEMAIARLNAEAKDYSTAIVNTLIAEHRAAKPIPSLAVAGPVKNIEDRIKTILKPHKKFYKRPTFLVIVAVALAAAITVPTTIGLTSRTEPDLSTTGTSEEHLSELTAKLARLASLKPQAITLETLADICEAMESVIVDISLEYEWYLEPPSTEEDIAGTGLLTDKGRRKYQWSTAKPFTDRVRVVQSGIIANANGKTWHSMTKDSYNGKIGKHVVISRTLDGDLRTPPDGIITASKRFLPSIMLSPLGFSVLRLSFSKVVHNIPLSAVLRREELVRLDRSVRKANGFNTIHVNLLQESTKQTFMRIYFSVDHGYTPVRYEHISGKPETTSLVFDVHSLEQVAERLWFPSSGATSTPDNKQINVYRATSKISVNQGFTDEYFDIEFPPGTRVTDEIKDTEYLVRPSKEQQENWEKEQQWIKEHADQMAAMEKEGGRVYSASRLMRLGKIKDIYMMSQKENKFPETLDDLEPYLKDKEIFSWLLQNVEYLGSALDPNNIDVSKTPIAYDRTLLEKGQGTNVLFVNSIVEFCEPARLEKLSITANPKTKLQHEEQRGQFKARPPNGVTVELVGVCEYPSRKSWCPDGSEIQKQIYATKWNKKNPRPDEFGIMFKLSGPEDLSFSWHKINGSDSYEGSCEVMDDQGNQLEGFDAAIALIKNKPDTTSVKVGIAVGPWKTVAVSNGKGMCIEGGIAFASAYESNGAVRIVVTDSFGNEVVQRVTAIDNSGNIHLCKGTSGSVSNQNLRQTTANFPDLDLNRVKEFRFQIRPYEWVEFKNVSLHPGLKTDVEVEVAPKDSAQQKIGETTAKPATGTRQAHRRVELFYDDGSSEGQRSIPAGGHAAIFGAPGEGYILTAVSLRCTPAGASNDPAKNFHLWLLDDQFNLINDFTLAYSDLTARRNTRTSNWVKLLLQPVEVPATFVICVGFDPTPQKPIYLHYDASSTGNSFVGLPGQTMEPFAGGQWMMRAVLHQSAENTAIEDASEKTTVQVEVLGGEGDSLRVYEVNRRVSDFPEPEDLSTPEAAYAAINRVSAGGEASGWQRVSVKRLAERLAGEKDRGKMEVEPEWAEVLLNAQILEVRIWKGRYAMVLAELPQEYSSEKIREPIDLRSLEFEDGRWLNAGNDRAWTVEQGRAIFVEACEYRKREAEKQLVRRRIEEVMKHPEEIVQAADQLFEKIRNADYDYFLEAAAAGWKKDEWHKFPTVNFYMVRRDYPGFVQWCCENFKANPIVSVEVGEVFIGDKQIIGKSGWPTVPYKLTLKDGSVLEGDLPFEYNFDGGVGHWHGMEGIDSHLQDEPIKKPDEQVDVNEHRAKLRADFEKRMARDKVTYTDHELSEIEHLYQIANKKWKSQEAQDSLEKLVARYAKANRTGCAVLYLGQMSDGAQKERYLKRAIEDFSDCMYGDGVRVGAFARYLLAMYYEETGRKDEAKGLITELINGYPDAVGHNGKLLIEQIPDALKVAADSKSKRRDKNKKETDQNPIGKWRSVDFVEKIEDFKPGAKSWRGELFLKDVEFKKGGKTSSFFTWRRGWIHHEDGRTKARYQIKKINGATYLFLPWLSGDVTIRGQKPSYYVMEQVGGKQAAKAAKSERVSQHPVGKWRSVDLVRQIEDFEPGVKSFSGELFLQEVEFNKGGTTSSFFTWRRGWIHHEDGRTRARYQIKKINGVTYLFLPWLSGDVTIRGQKPWYYVMEKVGEQTTRAESERKLTNEAVYKQLEKIFDFSELHPEMHFADALDMLKNSVDPPLNVYVFWNDLYDEADVDRTSPINLDSAAKVPLKMAFNLLLDSVSGGFADLTYTVADGLIYIGPKKLLRKKVKTSTHHISDVVGPPATATIP